MKILFLTQYFPPETGAPQNRLFELAVRLQKKGATVNILTAMPNYPQMEIHPAYKGMRVHEEEMEGLKIYRSWIYVKKSSSIFLRLLNYFSFVYSSWRLGRKIPGHFDYIFCESPPLFLGITAWLLKKNKKSRLIFNVSDLWPESAEKLGLVTNRFFLTLATHLEEFLYRKSDLITGQTKGIVRNIQDRFPAKTVYWLPNGVDMGIYNFDQQSGQSFWRKQSGFSNTDFIFLYAGIVGHAQGLDVILHAAEILRKETSIHFVIMGSGPEKERLQDLSARMKLGNILFLDAVGKPQMPAIISAADVAIVPLKRLDLFKGAIPSKIFENLAMRKPLLLGVEGEAKEMFIDEGKAGFAFIPEDAADLAAKALDMFRQKDKLAEMGQNGYDYVSKSFTRDLIAEQFWMFLEADFSKKRSN
ncbi:MAG TPA: glycosyltransferase family 4 protein [Bacteroidia bacterium]|jgi:glycosyltransferase involved in cell wall biosynthesis|nr:glycosyltransferase family 4 protein [Bacteroidia bacterium]